MTQQIPPIKPTKSLGKLALIVLFTVLLLTVIPKETHASLFDDFLNEMNNKLKNGVGEVLELVNPGDSKNKALTIDSNITLADNGDVNRNGQIDAGDTITFTYNIQNTTDKKYAYATLKTNIQRDSLNYIRNVSGVTGLKEDGKTIDFPNLRVEPGMVKQISFDATINYFTDSDPILSTEPELISEDKNSILKAPKKEIQAKRIKKEDIPEQIQMFKKKP